MPVMTTGPEGACTCPSVKVPAVDSPQLGPIPLLDGHLLLGSLGPNGARDDEVSRNAADGASPHLRQYGVGSMNESDQPPSMISDPTPVLM